jgi:hypothetical protein
MTTLSNEQTAIIRTERGLTIALPEFVRNQQLLIPKYDRINGS